MQVMFKVMQQRLLTLYEEEEEKSQVLKLDSEKEEILEI